jgi:hypothetical protein
VGSAVIRTIVATTAAVAFRFLTHSHLGGATANEAQQARLGFLDNAHIDFVSPQPELQTRFSNGLVDRLALGLN